MRKENCGLQTKIKGARFQQTRIAKEAVNVIGSFEEITD